MAPEPAAAAPSSAAPKHENVFTRKIGPLPMWGWVAIIATVLIGYAYYQSRKSSSSSAADTTATGTDASQVPQFVNQTYTTVTPPTAPVPPPSTSPGGGSGGTVNPGGPQIPGHHVVTATGHETLAQIAKRYHTTPGNILKFTEQHKTHISPTEAKFFKGGGKGKIPKGLVLWVPEPQVKVG